LRLRLHEAKEHPMTVARHTLLWLTAAGLAAALSPSPAHGQAPPSGTTQPAPEQRQVAPTRPDDGTGPQQGTSTPPSGSLSNELNRSGGVLQPPPTGDQGVVAPPKAGPQSTPVIPPPGTPGGNQGVQPK
jgi:hypothetical protein